MKSLFTIILTIFFFFKIGFAQNEMIEVQMNTEEFKSLVAKLAVAKRQNLTYKQYVMYRQVQWYKNYLANQGVQPQVQQPIVVQETPKSPASTNTTVHVAPDPRIDRIEKLLEQMRQQGIKENNKTPINTKTATVSNDDLEKFKKDMFSKMEEMQTQVLKENKNTPITTSPSIASNDLGDFKKEMQSMILQMQKELQAIPKPTASAPVIVQVPESTSATDAALFKNLANSLNQTNASIKGIEQKLNDLENQQVSQTAPVVISEKVDNSAEIKLLADELKSIKKMIAGIDKSKSTHTKETLNTVTNNNLAEIEYLKEVIKGKEVTNIYFENGSTLLNVDARNLINAKIVNLIDQHERLDVIIAGYTSEKGTPLLNQELSLQRTESVKRYLMKNGIHATRIFSEYHGIDYNAADASTARRVELRLLIRK